MVSAAVVAFGVSVQAQDVQSFSTCGPLSNHYGPYDYRTDKGKLVIVDNAHFTPEVEALLRGSTGDLNKDINYTLRTSPNHHRALLAVSRLALKTGNPQPRGFDWPLECYFERALRFRQDDTVARMIYAQHLGNTKRVEEATKQIDRALAESTDNPLTQYNAGLLFFDMGLHDQALNQAHLAAKMGLQRPELQNMLKKANRWRDAAQ